jgi:restriction endonuclease S subunit
MVSSTGHGHASLNRIHYQEGKFALGSILCAVYSKDESRMLTKYLYYYLSVYKDTLLVPLMKGSANVALNLSSLKGLEIDIPALSEQQKLLKNFDSFELEITKVREQFNKVLIDIDGLFVSKMEEIINTQNKVLIDNLFNIKKGSLQSSKNTPGEYAFVTASEEWKTSSTYDNECEALIFAMGAAGSLGRTHYVNDKFIASDLCYVLTPKEDIDLKFYDYIFKHYRQIIVSDIATGSAKKAINATNFKSYRFPHVKKEKSDLWINFFVELSKTKDTIKKQLCQTINMVDIYKYRKFEDLQKKVT